MKRRGRPRHEDEQGSVNLTLRLRMPLRDALWDAARANCRSLNGEVTARLKASLEQADILETIKETIRAELRRDSEPAPLTLRSIDWLGG